MPRPNVYLGLRLTEAELARCRACAALEGFDVSTWLRALAFERAGIAVEKAVRKNGRPKALSKRMYE